MKRSKKFKNLMAKTETYMERGLDFSGIDMSDMAYYVTMSRQYREYLDELADKITEKYHLED